METRYRFLSNKIIELKEALRQAEITYRSAKDAHAKEAVGGEVVRKAYGTYFDLQNLLEYTQAEFFSVQSQVFA